MSNKELWDRKPVNQTIMGRIAKRATSPLVEAIVEKRMNLEKIRKDFDSLEGHFSIEEINK